MHDLTEPKHFNVVTRPFSSSSEETNHSTINIQNIKELPNSNDIQNIDAITGKNPKTFKNPRLETTRTTFRN